MSTPLEAAHEIEALADRLRHAIGAKEMSPEDVAQVLRSVQRGLSALGFAVFALRDDVPAIARDDLDAVSRLVGAAGSTIPAVAKLVRLGAQS